MKLSLGYFTAPNLKEAREIVAALLQEELIACANILPAVESHFVWKGELVKENEVLIILKTKTDNEDKIIDLVTEMHSYECPCIEFVSLDYGNPEFLKWIDKSC